MGNEGWLELCVLACWVYFALRSGGGGLEQMIFGEVHEKW